MANPIGLVAAQEPGDHRQDRACNDAGRNREVYICSPPAEMNVAGKAADPPAPNSCPEHEACRRDHAAKYDESPSEFMHGSHYRACRPPAPAFAVWFRSIAVPPEAGPAVGMGTRSSFPCPFCLQT